MKRVMHQISVDTNEDGDVVLSQQIHDMNEPDPEILITPDQAPLVAAWLYEAGEEANAERSDTEQKIPVRLLRARARSRI